MPRLEPPNPVLKVFTRAVNAVTWLELSLSLLVPQPTPNVPAKTKSASKPHAVALNRMGCA